MPINNNKVDVYARQLASQGASFVSPTGSGLMVSSGAIVKPTIIYNTGGTVTIGNNGSYRFYHTTNYFGEITEHAIAGTTLNIPDQITSYIVADYNSGNPQYFVTTDLSTINFSNKTAVYTCSRVEDTNVDILDWDEPALSLANKILRRDMECRRFERVTGLNLSEDTGRKIVISAGVVWQGSFRNSRIQVDSVTNHCEQVNTDINGDFTGSVVTAYNNSQFDTGTGLSTLTDGNYAVNWIYRSMGINANNIIILLGNGDYDLNEAKTAQPPNNVPPTLSTNALLIGRIVVLKGSQSSLQIDSVWTTTYSPSTTTSHSGLTGLQGGLNGDYYHSNQLINTDSDVEFLSIIGKANTNDGSTNVFEGKDSDEATIFSIDSDGKVGIGGAPSAVSTTKLNVVGDAVVTENMGIGGLPDDTASLKVTGDAIITGNLHVIGTTETENSVDLEVLNKNISLAVIETPSDVIADGGGIILKGTTDKTILYNNGTKSWDVSENITIPIGKKLTTENVSSDTDIILTTSGTGSIINTSDIIPATTNTRSLGSLLKVFLNIFTRRIESDDALTIKTASNKNLNIISGSAGQCNVSSEGSGSVNIATDAHAKTVTIGNVTEGTVVNINSGTGGTNIKSSTNDGSTNIINGLDSDGISVFKVDTDGNTSLNTTTLVEQVTSPSSPVSGNLKVYVKGDGKLYTMDSDGVESEIGGNRSVDYVYARPSGEVTTANTTIPVTTVLAGNVSISNNMFNLKLGITYELEACMEFRGDAGMVWAEYIWTDSSGVKLPVSNIGISIPVQSLATDSETIAKAIITPSQDMSVKVMTTSIVSNTTGLATTRSYFKITQIGSTAQTLNSGTEAQRIAMSPTIGYEFYQIDGSYGKYIYNGTRWDKISNLAYLKASNTATVNPSADTLLNFSVGVVSNGIKTNMGGGRYELYPGNYELMGVQLLNQNDAGISYQFYNYTTFSYIGEQGNAADVIGSAGTGSPAFAILECTVDTQIGLRCSNDSATVTATEGSWLKIRQIS